MYFDIFFALVLSIALFLIIFTYALMYAERLTKTAGIYTIIAIVIFASLLILPYHKI